MNQVVLIGRLVRDPELRFSPNTQTAITHFTLAVDRPTQQGGGREADFIRITVFGKQAENVDRYLSKGSQAAVLGRIQTGSYQNKDGQTVYTTDVIANRVEFLGGRSDRQGGDFGGNRSFGGGQQGEDHGGSGSFGGAQQGEDHGGSGSFGGGRQGEDLGEGQSYPDGFQAVEDDLPF